MIARQLVVVSFLTLLSQLAAFFKLWFTARLFGVGSELDGYNLALVVPSLIAGVSAGFIQTGFFPLRARMNVRGDFSATQEFERALWWCYALLGIVLTCTAALATPWLANLLTPHDLPAVRKAFSFVMPFAAVLIVLNMVSDYSGYLLATRGLFAVAAGAPIANGILGGLLLAMWPQGGLACLALGTLAGISTQLALCISVLHIRGFLVLGGLPAWSGFKMKLREMASLGAWVLPGVCFSNMVVSLPPVWAARFGDGAASAFAYAYRLHSSMVQLLVMASSTVLLAHLSNLIASGDRHAVRQLLRTAATVSCVIGFAALVGVGCLGEQLLLGLFGGRFDAAAASRVTALWFWLSAGLGFAMLGNVFAKLWQAQARPKLISAMAAASLFGLCIGYLTLSRLFGEQSVALALSVSAMTVVLLGYKRLGNPASSASAKV